MSTSSVFFGGERSLPNEWSQNSNSLLPRGNGSERANYKCRGPLSQPGLAQLETQKAITWSTKTRNLQVPSLQLHCLQLQGGQGIQVPKPLWDQKWKTFFFNFLFITTKPIFDRPSVTITVLIVFTFTYGIDLYLV